jgi:hypothetical protein
MPIWYNEAKDGSIFSSASITDWNTVNSTIVFDELAFRSDENFYYLFMYAKTFTDLMNVGVKNWEFKPCLIQIKIARIEKYQKYDFKEKKNVEGVQSLPEKLLCNQLENLEESKFYSGKITLRSGEQVIGLVTGIHPSDGKPIPDDIKNYLLNEYFRFEEITEPIYLKADDLKLPAKKSYSGSSQQSELAKIQDREKYIYGVLKQVFPAIPDDFNIYRFALDPTHGSLDNTTMAEIFSVINHAARLAGLPQNFLN